MLLNYIKNVSKLGTVNAEPNQHGLAKTVIFNYVHVLIFCFVYF